MESQPLRSLSSVDSVSNVCLFVSDSLRLDYLPDWIGADGLVVESIAAASYTAASIPSMITGQYPSTHGCWRFDDRLPATPPLFTGTHSYRAGTIWTHLDEPDKPPIRMTRAGSHADIDELAEQDEGFVYVEHDKGGHSPYGHSFDEYSTPSFFESLEDPERIPDLYEESIQRSAERFRELTQRLREHDILDDTLVIFTSDHGELLGESSRGGLYNHGRPMTPEVVRVPLVFMGAGLPEGESYDGLTASVDIAPTVLSALCRDAGPVDGHDLWRESIPGDRTPRSEFWLDKTVRRRQLTVYRATSRWSRSGGVVYQFPPRWARLAYAVWAHLHSEPSAGVVRKRASLRSLTNMLKLYASNVQRFGEPPGIDIEALRESDAATSPANSETTDHYTDEQLRHLGYID